MTSAQITDARVEQYLSRLEICLRGVAPLDKEDILQEIRVHILDATAGASDRDVAVDRVLRLLGTPEELAGRYGTESLLARASRSFSPWLLLRTCWRWAMLGVKGTGAFLLAFTGYSIALALTVSVFLKPFVPAVGLWLGKGTLHVGAESNSADTIELLGKWFVPVIAVTAFAVAIGTTQALRWMIRRRASNLPYQLPKTGFSWSAKV